MTNDKVQAYATVQTRLMKRSDTGYWPDRLERTANYLISSLDRTREADHMVRDAWGSAGKVERTRSTLQASTPKRDLTEQLTLDSTHACTNEVEHRVFEILDFVERIPLGDRERMVLGLLAQGKDTDTIAKHLGVTPATAKVVVCRTRQKAKALWEAA